MDRPAPHPSPARLEALVVLPVFLKLAGRRAVLAGHGAPLAWKAELIAAAGADVLIFSRDPAPELRDWIDRAAGRVVLTERDWTEQDLQGAALAILEPDEDQAATRRFTDAARRAGALANVIDFPSACEFQFGTIVNRSPLIIGISTDGAAPILGQALRRRIEAILPRRIGEWAAGAKGYRERLTTRLPRKDDRRSFWEAFVDRCLGPDGSAVCHPETFERLADEIETGSDRHSSEVTVVGAGPGDPELMTLKGMRALQSADLILHESGIGAGVLELARREAERLAFDDPGAIATMLDELPHRPARIALLVRDVRAPAIAAAIASCQASERRVAVVPGVEAI